MGRPLLAAVFEAMTETAFFCNALQQTQPSEPHWFERRPDWNCFVRPNRWLFSSSLFEVAGEATASATGPMRIICNSDLDPEDIVTAAAARAAILRGVDPRLLDLTARHPLGQLKSTDTTSDFTVMQMPQI